MSSKKQISEILHEMRRKPKLPRDHEPTVSEKIQAMSNDRKGRQMIEESPIYEMKDGKEKLLKPRTGPRRSVSFLIGKQPWKEKKNNG
ncbi:MAG TPA: hypothetical protein ENI23_13140 [bacterium]|nr:hypothetical protein [bacterium]